MSKLYLLIILVFTVSANNETKVSLHSLSLDNLQSSHCFTFDLTSIVECARQQITNGIPFLGIKTLDPLKLILIPLIINNSIIKSSMLLTHFKLEGMAGFEMKEGKVVVPIIPIKADMNLVLNFNKIRVKTNYRGTMTLFGFIKLYGKGILDIEFDNFNFDTKMKMRLTPPRVNNFNIFITLPTTKVKITGLFYDEYLSDLISQQMTDTFTSLAKEENKRLNDFINRQLDMFVKFTVNPFLQNPNKEVIKKIISFIRGMNCKLFATLKDLFNVYEEQNY